QEFQRDLDLEREVECAVDHAHAADADQGFDAEAAREHLSGAQFTAGALPGLGGCRVAGGTGAGVGLHGPTIARLRVPATARQPTRPRSACHSGACASSRASASTTASILRCMRATSIAVHALRAIVSTSSRSRSVTGGPGRRLST